MENKEYVVAHLLYIQHAGFVLLNKAKTLFSPGRWMGLNRQLTQLQLKFPKKASYAPMGLDDLDKKLRGSLGEGFLRLLGK